MTEKKISLKHTIVVLVAIILVCTTNCLADIGIENDHHQLIRKNFKNGGFESGLFIPWVITGDSTYNWFHVVNNSGWARTGNCSAVCIVDCRDINGGSCFISQQVDLSRVESIQFSVRVYSYINLFGSTEHIKVYIDNVEIYDECVDGRTQYTDISIPISQIGIKTVSFGVVFEGRPASVNVVLFDDIYTTSYSREYK